MGKGHRHSRRGSYNSFRSPGAASWSYDEDTLGQMGSVFDKIKGDADGEFDKDKLFGPPGADGKRSPIGQGVQAIMALQREMKKTGDYTGEVDGKWGPLSVAGAQKFSGGREPGTEPGAEPGKGPRVGVLDELEGVTSKRELKYERQAPKGVLDLLAG